MPFTLSQSRIRNKKHRPDPFYVLKYALKRAFLFFFIYILFVFVCLFLFPFVFLHISFQYYYFLFFFSVIFYIDGTKCGDAIMRNLCLPFLREAYTLCYYGVGHIWHIQHTYIFIYPHGSFRSHFHSSFVFRASLMK